MLEPGPQTNTETSKVSQIAALIGGEAKPEKKPEPVETLEQSEPTVEEVEEEATAIESQPDTVADSDAEPDQVEIENDNTPPTLTDLAETLELSEKDLYGVEVPMRGVDEKVTLGNLKDTWKEHQTLIAERTEYNETRETQVNEMMVADRQLNQFIEIARSTGQLTKPVLDRLNELHSNNVAQQQRSLMTAIPEWNDATVRTADFEDLVQFLGDGYGLTRAQVANTTSATHLKIAYDAMKAKNIVRDHKREVNKPTNIKAGQRNIKPGKNAALNAKIQAAKRGNNEQKAAAIADLINTT